MADRTAAELVARAREDISSSATPNRFLDLLEQARVPRTRLTWLAGEEFRIVDSDRRSFALLAARFPEPPAGEFFLGLAQGEAQAFTLLHDFAAALGMGEKDLRAYEPHPAAQSYPAYLAQRAAYGTAAEVALGMLANLEEWGNYCARTASALRTRYGLAEDAVAFFTFFGAAPPGFADQALAIVTAGLTAGESPEDIARAPRLLHSYETAFWDTLASDLP